MAKVRTIGGLLLCVAISVRARATTCNSVAGLKLPDTVITVAQDIGAGKFVPSEGRPSDLQLTAYKGLPAFCRVRGVIKTVSRVAYRVRSVAANQWLERQIHGRRERWVGRVR